MWKLSFDKLKQGLAKTRAILNTDLRDLFGAGRKIDQEILDQVEEQLILSDVGHPLTHRFMEELRKAFAAQQISDTGEILPFLKKLLTEKLAPLDRRLRLSPAPPTVVMVSGVNGTGKTTSIAKLANHLQQEGNKVLLAACDTFRAAAVEQLTIWSDRLGVDIVRHQQGADPGAVAFDAMEAALARKADYLIVDTAGRLHTESTLMKELEKISRVLSKRIPGAPHEVLLVLDATTGQNALVQARQFHQSVPLTGIILAKLDGTAKGGVVLAIQEEMPVPVKFVGVGEQLGDLQPFDPASFVEALFSR